MAIDSKIIREWLIDEGIFRQEIHDDKFTFNYLCEFPSGSNWTVNVLQPKGKKDSIIIASVIFISEEHRKKLFNLLQKDREKFFLDLKFGLLFRETEFAMLPDLEKLERIEFRQVIYDDELSKSNFHKSMSDIHKCKLFVVWKFQEMFG